MVIFILVTRNNVGSGRTSSSSYGVENFRAKIHLRRSIVRYNFTDCELRDLVCIESRQCIEYLVYDFV